MGRVRRSVFLAGLVTASLVVGASGSPVLAATAAPAAAAAALIPVLAGPVEAVDADRDDRHGQEARELAGEGGLPGCVRPVQGDRQPGLAGG
ncbi:MAG: hypothetical protein JWM19_7966 [Actinomycetia bacterium]|nr:hypothetical protein [Actinomycetes bacterium]